MQSFFSKYNSKSANVVLDKQNHMALKDWKRAITIYRSNIRMAWGEINGKLESIIKRKSEVLQVAADQAIFWCREEQEIKGLLSKPNQLSTYKMKVTMGRWRKEDHWQNLQINVRHS